MRTEFDCDFAATELEARAALCDVMARLAVAGLAPDEAGTVEIALAEAVNNIVEHAYPDSAPGRVVLACRLSEEALGVTICDRGQAMPGGAAPDGIAPDVDVAMDDLPEGGFGWMLIRELAREVIYSRVDGQNRLSLIFDRAV